MVSLKFNTLATIIGFLLAIPVLSTSTRDSDGATYPTVRDIIPEEYIKQVHAYHEALAKRKEQTEWQNAKRTLSVLQKRIPADQHCPEGWRWLQRDCAPDNGERAYQDLCQDVHGDLHDVNEECPHDTMCVDDRVDTGRVDDDDDPIYSHDIACWPKTPKSQDMVTTRRKRYKSQYGYRFFTGSSSTQDISIPVYIENPRAVVSGELVSKYYLIFM